MMGLSNNFLVNFHMNKKMEKMMDKIEANCDKPDLRVQRIAASRFAITGEVDHNEIAEGQTIFTQMLKQMKVKQF